LLNALLGQGGVIFFPARRRSLLADCTLFQVVRSATSGRIKSAIKSRGVLGMTPAGPEMKMKLLMEEDLHLVELRLAACELWTTTCHELDVCSLLGSCSLRISNSTCGEASMQSVGVASHPIVMVSQGLLETRRVAKCMRMKGGFDRCRSVCRQLGYSTVEPAVVRRFHNQLVTHYT
jgi:hypothetical protein